MSTVAIDSGTVANLKWLILTNQYYTPPCVVINYNPEGFSDKVFLNFSTFYLVFRTAGPLTEAGAAK